jgi:hypothetical protein
MRRLDLGLSVALAATLGLNAFLLVRRASPASGSLATPIAGAAATSRAIPCPPSRLSPERALSPATASNASSPGGAGFDREERDPAWATAQEAAIHEHIVDMATIAADVSVECRARCCAITGDDVLSPAFILDLQTSAGLMPWAERLSFSDRVIACFDRSAQKRPPTALARRRKEILGLLQPTLERCARLTTVPVEITILVGFDTSGKVVGTHREGELSGSEVARCADQAVTEAASFAPQPYPGGIPFFIHFEPAP